MYGKGFDTGTSQVGAGSLSFGAFSFFFFFVFPWVFGRFSYSLALFSSLWFCGGGSVDKNLPVVSHCLREV